MMVAENREGVPYSAWGVSLGVHALIIGLAFMITAQVQPILKEEIFQWEVALVQPSPDSPQTETSQSTPTVQPVKPTADQIVQTAQPIQPVEPTSDMVMTRVATPYSPEIVHPTIAPPKPEPVQEIVQAKVQPVLPEETKKEEIKKEAVKPEPVAQEQHPAPVVREVAPPVEAVATAQAYEPPASSRAHHAESAPVIHHEGPSPEEMAPEWRPLVAVRERSAQAMPAPAAASSAPAVVESTAVAAAPVQAPPHHADAQVVANAASVRPATKADNAWLAESLGRRIKELTRYPSSARLNGSEGKVVLRVILRADGHLVDVVVHRSSGHEVLDRAAMETVRLACPIHMKQALSAAEVAVYVPIVYSLAG
jgi:protein TonB